MIITCHYVNLMKVLFKKQQIAEQKKKIFAIAGDETETYSREFMQGACTGHPEKF